MSYNISTAKWYAVQTIYCRELLLKDWLDKRNIQSFIPMTYHSVVENEKKTFVEQPAIHNLVFIRSTKKEIDDIRQTCNIGFNYINNTADNLPATITEEEMNEFIRITKMAGDEVMYLRDNIDKFKKYSRIRITGGRFEGAEGYLVRIRRDRKVVIALKNIAAIALSGIDPSLIELMD